MARHYRLCLLALTLLLFVAVAFYPNIAVAYPTGFDIPAYNGKISFDGAYTFQDATFENNVWSFKGLSLVGVVGDFSISAKGSNITITHYNPTSQDDNLDSVLHAAYLRYLVEGVGEQTFNMHCIWDIPLKWTVKIDDVQRAQGDGWDYSNGWLTVKGATFKVVVSCEPMLPSATPSFDAGSRAYFASPELNSSVSFADRVQFAEFHASNPNGKYIEPTLTKYPNVTYFKTVNASASLPHTAWWYAKNILHKYEGTIAAYTLAVYAKNSNITVNALNSTWSNLPEEYGSHMIRTDNWLNYSVSGVGEQASGLFPAGKISTNTTAVYIDGTLRERGDGWQLSETGWLTITGAKSNVSIHTWGTHYAGPSLRFTEPDYTPLWIALAATAALIITICYLKIRKAKKQ